MNQKILTALAAAALLAGCAHTKPAAKASDAALDSAAPASQAQQNPEGEPSLRGKILHSVPDVETVYFAYDSSALTDAAQAALSKNAEWLRAHSDVQFQVAGYCDQRGTEEYNLALGQRRAVQVRDYYKTLGIAANRIATISYGKEKPVCSGKSESCWSRNRRAATLVSFPSDVSRSR
jgi:peptidoglycan-associated lipoprotein